MGSLGEQKISKRRSCGTPVNCPGAEAPSLSQVAAESAFQSRGGESRSGHRSPVGLLGGASSSSSTSSLRPSCSTGPGTYSVICGAKRGRLFGRRWGSGIAYLRSHAPYACGLKGDPGFAPDAADACADAQGSGESCQRAYPSTQGRLPTTAHQAGSHAHATCLRTARGPVPAQVEAVDPGDALAPPLGGQVGVGGVGAAAAGARRGTGNGEGAAAGGRGVARSGRREGCESPA